MPISKLWLHNIGPFDDVEIDIPPGKDPNLADVVLFCGPNGSGKTSVLLALETLLTGENVLGERWYESHVAAQIGDEKVGTSLASASTTLEEWAQGLDRKEWERRGANNVLQFLYQTSPKLPWTIAAGARRPPLTKLSDSGSAVVSWVRETRSKAALAHEAGNEPMAERYRAALVQCQRAVTDVIGQSFEFVLDPASLNVETRVNGMRVPLAVLPDGLHSILSWLAAVFQQMDTREPGLTEGVEPLVLLIDEIDAHLHPDWQRKVLPILERALPNAQIFATTHSPFVLQSATDACIVQLRRGEAPRTLPSQKDRDLDAVIADVLGIESRYSVGTEDEIRDFLALRDRVLRRDATLDQLRATGQALGERDESLAIAVGQTINDVTERLQPQAS